MYRPCAGIIQIRFNGSAANSRHLSPVSTEPPEKCLLLILNVAMERGGVNTSVGTAAYARVRTSRTLSVKDLKVNGF